MSPLFGNSSGVIDRVFSENATEERSPSGLFGFVASMLAHPILLLLPFASALQAPAARAPPAPVTPGKWHLQRRQAILAEHPEVSKLIGREPLTLPLLAGVNAAQIGLALAFADLPTPALSILAIFLGGTLSLWQFTLMHDIKHGCAVLPKGVKPDDVLFAGSLPALFGYFLYLRYGHLTHHKAFGTFSIKSLFDSDRSSFEDGDGLFVAHRQQMTNDKAGQRIGFFGNDKVGGLGISISRTIYSLFWLNLTATDADGDSAGDAAAEDASAGEPFPFEATAAGDAAARHQRWAREWLPALYHAAVFAFSMTYERAALVVGGGVVPALVGRNYFFPNKPDAFHATCTSYARASLLLALGLYAAAGPGAILWLFWAEVGWQLPIHPASAMFVSNHPSLDAPQATRGVGAASACQPTASIYLGAWYDWLVCFSNYHTEHHDFPDVPAFRLRALRDTAAPYYSDDALNGCRDGWWETMRRTFATREFYACAGAMEEVEQGYGVNL